VTTLLSNNQAFQPTTGSDYDVSHHQTRFSAAVQPEASSICCKSSSCIADAHKRLHLQSCIRHPTPIFQPLPTGDTPGSRTTTTETTYSLPTTAGYLNIAQQDAYVTFFHRIQTLSSQDSRVLQQRRAETAATAERPALPQPRHHAFFLLSLNYVHNLSLLLLCLPISSDVCNETWHGCYHLTKRTATPSPSSPSSSS